MAEIRVPIRNATTRGSADSIFIKLDWRFLL